MHAALRLDQLNRLPPLVRRAAHVACSPNRTLKDVRRIQIYLTTVTEEQRVFLLPVFYINLDLAGIPDEGQFNTENPPADAESRIGRALISLQSLYVIEFPTSIGPDIWPRVWPWVRFIYTYRENLPNIPPQLEDIFCSEFLMFAGTFADHAESFSLILSYSRRQDPKKREVAFNDLRRFIVDPGATEPSNLAEMIDGAGGMLPARGTTIHYMYVHFLCAILQFIAARGARPRQCRTRRRGLLGVFGAALVSSNIVRALINVACALGDAPVPQAEYALRQILLILANIFTVVPGDIQWVSDALQHHLLRAVVICARGPHATDIHGFLEIFIVGVIPPMLVYPGVLSAIVAQLVASDAFKNSQTYAEWSRFSLLAEERIGVLNLYRSGEAATMRACDNVKCGEIGIKSAVRRCAGCSSLYYCSPACQALDWAEGGHKKACKSYGALSLREDNELDLKTRERSFLRALIHHDYQKSKLTLFPPTGHVKISIQLLSSAPTRANLGGPEWMDIVSRAERSGGRMILDVLVLSGPDKGKTEAG
ncbi:hypothetical protein B0H11DRAFT_2134272 [Mycena galericulata]|nr:hypothetical protein B0H11DRAFT_2134272 [Mycena galericulata]